MTKKTTTAHASVIEEWDGRENTYSDKPSSLRDSGLDHQSKVEWIHWKKLWKELSSIIWEIDIAQYMTSI